MSTMSRHQPAGGPGRAAPLARTTLVAFTLIALSVSGCSSLRLGNGCGPCSGSSSGGGGPLKRMSQRIFNRHNKAEAIPMYAGDACEPGFVGGGVPMDMGAAPIITTPPSVAPGSPLAPSEVDSPPLELNPIQGTSNRPAAKSLYEAQRPTGELATAGGNRVALSPTDPTLTSTGLTGDPLSKFEPKLSPPTQLEPVPSSLPQEAEALPASKQSSLRPAAPAAGVEPSPPASLPEPAGTTPTDDSVAGLAPGFRSFKSVEPRLAGGSLPTASGFGWLNEQGFRTVIDLRPTGEVTQDEIAQIQSKGLKYVALPVDGDALADPKTLERFTAELSQEASRPVYFFDADGSRAAALWYLYRVARSGATAADAEREADEIGPRNTSFWAQAVESLKTAKPAPAAVTNPPVVPQPPDAPVPDR